MTRRIFFDTNVLLDHLLERESFADDAGELWSMAERREIIGCISAISFNFVYYIVRQAAGHKQAMRAIKGLRDVFEIVEVDAQIINQAIDAGFGDFEDAIQHACAIRTGASHLITRDLAGFRHAEVPVVSPDAYLTSQDDA